MSYRIRVHLDTQIVQSLYNWFDSGPALRTADKYLTIVPLLLIALLVVVAWLADWGRATRSRSYLVVGALGAILALIVNAIIGHFYFRSRPFVVMDLVPLVPHAADSSFFSDHLAVAGGLVAGLFAARRSLGVAGIVLALLLAIGRVGAALHYPSDVIAGAAVGVACFFVLMPGRRLVDRGVELVAGVERRITPRAYAARHSDTQTTR